MVDHDDARPAGSRPADPHGADPLEADPHDADPHSTDAHDTHLHDAHLHDADPRHADARHGDARRDDYWRRTRQLTVALLLAWVATGFLAVYFARELAGLTLFGWPLSFYMAAQGASLVYLAITGIHAWRMRRLDRLYRERA